jgi:hypothetical protein
VSSKKWKTVASRGLLTGALEDASGYHDCGEGCAGAGLLGGRDGGAVLDGVVGVGAAACHACLAHAVPWPHSKPQSGHRSKQNKRQCYNVIKPGCLIWGSSVYTLQQELSSSSSVYYIARYSLSSQSAYKTQDYYSMQVSKCKLTPRPHPQNKITIPTTMQLSFKGKKSSLVILCFILNLLRLKCCTWR